MTVSKYAKKQTPQEIESAIEVWESQYAPPEFIRDESPEGQHNARMLASVLQSGFFGHFSPSNLSEALQRYRDQFHWRAQQAVPPQPTAEELAAQAETERLAAKARMLERQEEMLRKQNRSGRYNHADPPKQDLSSTADGFRRTVNAQNEARAKVEAEALAIVKMGYFIEGGGPGLPASLSFPVSGKTG